MEFRSLEVFYSVATLKNFGRAAEALNMTQSAVSQRITGLEAEVGARLLERSIRGTSPTPKGEILLAYADRLLRLRAELLKTIADPRNVSRLIRLGVSDTIAQTWLTTFIASANGQFPFITFEIEVDVTTNLRASLMRQEIDLAFLLGHVMEPGITSLDLCSYPLSFVASANLELDHNPVSIETLSRYPLISFPKNTINYRYLQDIFQRQAHGAPRIHSSSSVSTIVRMTLDGIGISIIPAAVIRAELAGGTLVRLETGLDLPALDYTVSYARLPDGQIIEALANIACNVARDYA